MDVQFMLDQLAEYKAQLDVLAMSEKEQIDLLIPEDIKAKIADLKNEMQFKRESAVQNIADLEAQIQAAVIAGGESVKGARMIAQFNKGRVTWDSKGVEGFALAHPALLAYRKEGNPYVTIKFNGK